MILQDKIPYDIADKPLPGIQPLDPSDWLRVDDAYAAQMRERRRLCQEQWEDVHAMLPPAEDAARELLELVRLDLADRPEFTVEHDCITGPDGHRTQIDRDAPLMTLASLVQEDFCLLTKAEGAREHVLTGAILCFPASWRLSEKIGKPLVQVHEPVPEYTSVAARVQRLFDGVQVGRPLWRRNVLWYQDATLYQPRSAHVPRPIDDTTQAPFLRSEHQTLLRLPRTRAVVFGIHTYVVAAEAVCAS
ncbi:heme-dependent oxidative N-demethylase family protein [Primorskyibacter sp. S187A]|uniref:heme-dependent oxidative N-demethylase family protein n=1 Tax=Primorskyibacter sp. S187A TaxID=3415130 RepID=UPI003C7A6CB4